MKNVYLTGLFALCLLLCASIAVADDATSVKVFSMYNDTDLNIATSRGIEINIFGPDQFDEPAIKAVFGKSKTEVGQNIMDIQHRLDVWGPGTLVSEVGSDRVSTEPLSVCPVGWTNPVHQSGIVVVETYSNRTNILFMDIGMKATQYDSEFGVLLSAIDGADIEAYTMEAPQFAYGSVQVVDSADSMMVYDP